MVLNGRFAAMGGCDSQFLLNFFIEEISFHRTKFDDWETTGNISFILFKKI